MDRREIPFQSLTPIPVVRDSINWKLNNIMDSGRYLNGSYVAQFEDRFPNMVSRSSIGVSCGNGFDALVMSLRAVDVCSTDCVIVPSNAPLPVWMAVSAVNAYPLPCAPADNNSYNVSYKTVMDALNTAFREQRRVKAIILVHMFGNPIADIADIYADLKPHYAIIEDCCQAHGATVNNRSVGNFSTLSAWSFYPTKNLGAFGDAGMVIGPHIRSSMVEKVRQMREYGGGERLGVNSRMDEFQAAVLLAKLPELDTWNMIRRDNASLYRKHLKDCEDWIVLPTDAPGHVYHQFVVRIQNREFVRDFLKNNGVETMVHYPVPPFKMPYYSLPLSYEPYSEQLSQCVLSLPIAPHITETDIDYICYLLKLSAEVL